MYENLNQLIKHSSSSRRFLLSLPVSHQLWLHEQNDYIRSAEQLRLQADKLGKIRRQIENSEHCLSGK